MQCWLRHVLYLATWAGTIVSKPTPVLLVWLVQTPNSNNRALFAHLHLLAKFQGVFHITPADIAIERDLDVIVTSDCVVRRVLCLIGTLGLICFLNWPPKRSGWPLYFC